MKKWMLLLAGWLTMSLSVSAKDNQSTADYQVIPLPESVQLQGGKSFVLNKQTAVVFPAVNAKMQKNAGFLKQYVQEATGIIIDSKKQKGVKNIIELALGLQSQNPEAYKITVNAQKITITGASESGVFYGIQTLRKSLPVDAGAGQVQMPAVIVNDQPRFSYRGMMLDVSRHFFTVKEVKTYIDMLALHNVNKFHWHLTDDQGWRVESKKYPRLTEVGSTRPETVIGRNSGKYDGIPHGGFYTQAELKEVIAYAADRYINVIPEIDLPGHMLGALSAYPELGCKGGPYAIWTQWGVSDDVLCAGNEKTLVFIKDILGELTDVFPSEYIHIGGDECPKTSWAKCEKCQSKIKSLGIVADEHHSAEERLQSYIISFAGKVLQEKGRKMIGWDEILEGGLAENATVMSWRGMGGGIEAAKQSHDVIMTPTQYAYFDYYQTNDTKDEPLAIGGYLPVKTVYSFEPVPSSLTDSQKKFILGAQANLWTEYVPNFKHAQYMVLPRMSALSEVQWSRPELKNYDQYLARLPKLIRLYEKSGYNYAKHLFDITSEFNTNPAAGSLELKLNTIDNAPIYYTLDGSAPTTSSLLFKDKIVITKNAEIKAQVFRSSGNSRVFTENVNFSKSSTKKITALQPENNSYKFNGVSALTDGLTGNRNYKTGRWIGFYNNDMEVVIDMAQATNFSSVSIRTNVEKGDWIFDARSLEVQVSNDGQSFQSIALENYPALTSDNPNGINTHTLQFATTSARYVKVKATTEKSIPEWHGGKGKPAYLFVDEITIQ